MDCLNEPEIINNISLRYNKDNIFTYIGPTLIVVNPYKILQNAFSQDRIAEIDKLMKIKPNYQLSDYQPHIYSIAGFACKNLFKNNRNQAVVISGESGAGKTENAKYAVRFIASLSSSKQPTH